MFKIKTILTHRGEKMQENKTLLNYTESERNEIFIESQVVREKTFDKTMERFEDDYGNNSEEIKNLKSNLDKANEQLSKTMTYTDTTIITNAIDYFKMDLSSRTVTRLFMVGDSTREANGAHVFNMVSEVLKRNGVECELQAKSGLKMEHWCEVNGTIQHGFPTVSQLIELIPNDGDGCYIDITGGINDVSTSTGDEIANYIEIGINKILARKPKCRFWVTSPNRYFYDIGNKKLNIAYESLSKKYGCIDVLNSVFKTWDNDIQSKYFVDNTHPNELGQKKIAEYELSKILPHSLFCDGLLRNIVYLKGGSDRNDNASELLSDAGFRVEIVVKNGSIDADSLYLFKNSEGKFHIYNDTTSGQSISKEVYSRYGLQSVQKATYASSSLDFECKVYISNPNILKYHITDGVYIKLNGAIVSEFSTETNYETLLINAYSMVNEITTINSYQTNAVVPNIPANGGVNFNVNVPNSTPSSYIGVTALYGMYSHNKFTLNASCSSAGVVTVAIRNFSSASVDGGNCGFKFIIV